MRLAIALSVVALSACTQAAEPIKRVRKAPAAPSVVKSLSLPGEDGRVHIVEVPGRLDVSRCLIHVGPAGSTIACLPATDLPPLEHDPAP